MTVACAAHRSLYVVRSLSHSIDGFKQEAHQDTVSWNSHRRHHQAKTDTRIVINSDGGCVVIAVVVIVVVMRRVLLTYACVHKCDVLLSLPMMGCMVMRLWCTCDVYRMCLLDRDTLLCLRILCVL